MKIIMRKFYALIFLLLFGSSFVQGQTDGDFRLYGDWSSADNWQEYDGGWVGLLSGIPNTIPFGNTLTIYYPSSIFIGANYTITNNGTILVDESFGAVTVIFGRKLGPFNNFVTFNNNGTFISDGDLDISNSDFYVNPNSTLTCNGSVTVNSSESNFYIKSDVSGSGSVLYDGALSGTIEQYISNNQWHLISPVFSDVVSGDYWDLSNDAYMRKYQNPGGGWGAYIDDENASLVVGQGYQLWETANYTYTYTGSGSFITGDKTLSIWQGGSGANQDWNLIGNPYPCGLDWGTIDAGIRDNCLGSAFYVYDTVNGYRAHDGDVGAGSGDVGDAPSGIIPSMQAFFVKSNGGGNIAIGNANKAHPDVNFYKSEKNFPDYISNLVRLNASYQDQNFNIVFYQREEATNGADLAYDAEVLFNNDPEFMEFYSFAGERPSMINVYNEYPYDVDLGMNVPAAGEFTISLSEFENYDENFTVILEDKVTGVFMDLLENSSYTFVVNEGGLVNDRLVLHLGSTVGIESLNSLPYSVFSNSNNIHIKNTGKEKYSVSVFSYIGQEVFRESNLSGDQEIQLTQSSGYYIVNVYSAKGVLTKKLLLTH